MLDFVLFVFEITVSAQCSKLLILEWNARGQRDKVPMNMSVGLLASEAEDIEALGWNHSAHRLGDPVDNCLQLEILIAGEIPGHLLPMLSWCDEDIPEEARVLVEESDGFVVLVDHVMGMHRIAGNQLTDEANTVEAPTECFAVDRCSLHAVRMLAGLPGVRPRQTDLLTA